MMGKAQVRVLPSARNTVMVVDDQSTGRAILEQVMRSLDERVVVEGFARPVDAVVWATRHISDLVLVDYMMPDMDGIEFVKRLRALPGYEHVPIVMVTVHDDRKVRYAALDAGITDFLTKPVDARECLARCRNLLTLRRQQLALEDRRRLLEGMVDEATREIREREKETLLRLARAGEFRDEETGYHLIRMARYSRLIANAIGITIAYFTIQPDYVNIANVPVQGWIAIILALTACFALGLVNALGVTAVGIPSFIMTLAMMQIANGISAMLVRGQIAYTYPDLITTLGRHVDRGAQPALREA